MLWNRRILCCFICLVSRHLLRDTVSCSIAYCKVNRLIKSYLSKTCIQTIMHICDFFTSFHFRWFSTLYNIDLPICLSPSSCLSLFPFLGLPSSVCSIFLFSGAYIYACTYGPRGHVIPTAYRQQLTKLKESDDQIAVNQPLDHHHHPVSAGHRPMMLTEDADDWKMLRMQRMMEETTRKSADGSSKHWMTSRTDMVESSVWSMVLLINSTAGCHRQPIKGLVERHCLALPDSRPKSISEPFVGTVITGDRRHLRLS